MNRVAQFWDAVNSDDSGATDGVALEEIERDVTEAMAMGNAILAESLTVKAWLLMSGLI